MRSGIVGTGAAPATFFTFGGGGSYFRNGSRPPLVARLFTAGFSGCISWATTPIAKPLATNSAAANSKLVNRIFDVSLTCIIIFAFLRSALLRGLRGWGSGSRHCSASRGLTVGRSGRRILQALGRNVISSQIKAGVYCFRERLLV